MSPRFKTISLVTGFIVFTVAITGALYILFFRPTPEAVPPVEIGAVPSAGLPTAGEGTGVAPSKIAVPSALPSAQPIAKGGVTETKALTAGRVFAPTLSSDGVHMAYYDKTDGRFYRIGDDGTVERLTDKKFADVDRVTWSPKGSAAVLEFPDGANVVYDFAKGTQVTLPAHWEDFGFSPNGTQVIAKSIGLDPNNRSLVITNTDGSNTKTIAALGNNADKVQVNWSPNDQIIAFSDTGPVPSGGLGRKIIIPIGKNQENFKGVLVEGFDFQSSWSPQGDTLLYSAVGAVNDYRPLLWVTDGRPNTIGDRRRSLGIATWADKCTFADNTTMYCAVPRSLPTNIGLQRVLADNIPDDIYRVNVQTGQPELVATPDTPQSIENLTVSGDHSALFFTNKATGVLERIRLK